MTQADGKIDPAVFKARTLWNQLYTMFKFVADVPSFTQFPALSFPELMVLCSCLCQLHPALHIYNSHNRLDWRKFPLCSKAGQIL